MSATNAYLAKAAAVDLMTVACGAATPGTALSGVDVSYAYRRDLGDKCIYGGGFTFTHEDMTGERNVLLAEVAECDFYARVVCRPRCDVKVADLAVSGIVNALGAVFEANPTLAGGIRWLDMPRGQGDYQMPTTDDETIAVMSFRLRFGSNVDWGL